MPAKNLKPCPNPYCTNATDSINVYVEKEVDEYFQRYRLTCQYCSYSSGWWSNFHEMVAWWNKWARPKKKKE